MEDILGHDDAELAAFITEVERRRDPSHIRAYRTVEWKAMLRARRADGDGQRGAVEGTSVG